MVAHRLQIEGTFSRSDTVLSAVGAALSIVTEFMGAIFGFASAVAGRHLGALGPPQPSLHQITR